jgi:SPP1 family predicted phage head-tail adaptor
MKTPRISDLSHRVTIEEAIRTPDGGGGGTLMWHAVDDVWAAILSVSGREIGEEDRRQARMTHHVWMRYRTDVKSNMRLVEGERVFDVHAVFNVDDEKRFLKLLCEEQLQ